eukprot:4613554-Pyramimonas_sp.AAC.1
MSSHRLRGPHGCSAVALAPAGQHGSSNRTAGRGIEHRLLEHASSSGAIASPPRHQAQHLPPIYEAAR